MIYRHIDALLLSHNSEFIAQVQSMFFRLGKICTVRARYDVGDVISADRPIVVICDMREDRDELKKIICQYFLDKRLYYCICIHEKDATDMPSFKGDNYLTLDEGCSMDKFFMCYYSAALGLNAKLDEIMYGTVSNERVQNTISNTIYRMGIAGKRRGIEYLKSAVSMIIYEPELGDFMTKDLYIRLGKQFGVTGGAIERAIRLMIKSLYLGGAKDEIDKLPYLSSTREYPKNSELIPALAKIVRRELDLINKQEKAVMDEQELETYLRKKAMEEMQKELLVKKPVSTVAKVKRNRRRY